MHSLTVVVSLALAAVTVPALVHAMREAGQIGTPRFGMMHGMSTGMLLIELILLAIAAWIG